MKKRILTVVLLIAGLGMAAAQSGNGGRDPFDMGSFVLENRGSSSIASTPDYDGYGVVFSGTADGQSASFTVAGTDLGINGKRRLIIKVSGLNSGCRFDMGKLLKLEINKTPISAGQGRNPGDPAFINARNGEYAFDLTNLGNITQITLVFYNCTLVDVKLEMFTE